MAIIYCDGSDNFTKEDWEELQKQLPPIDLTKELSIPWDLSSGDFCMLIETKAGSKSIRISGASLINIEIKKEDKAKE